MVTGAHNWGVVSPGMRIVDIVPAEDDLIVEVQLSPNDIDRVKIGQKQSFDSLRLEQPRTNSLRRSNNNFKDSFTNEATGIPTTWRGSQS